MSMNMKQLKRSIEEVLQENFADLEEMFSNEDMLKQFSSRLYQKKIVTKTTKDKPTFNQVVKEFNNYMIFMKTESDLHDHCISFITSLQSLEGPALKAAEILKSEWAMISENPTAQETNCSDEEGRHRSIYSYHGQYRASDTNTTSVYQGQRVPLQHPTSSSATVWSMNQGSHYVDSATQYPKTEQVSPHEDNDEQIRRHYTDPSYRYNFPPHKSDQSISQLQEEHESPDQSVPVTISSPTNDSRNPLQATTTFASETFSEEMLVAMSNGSTIPRSPSFNKHNNIQTKIDNLKTKVEHLQVQVNTKGAEIRNNTSVSSQQMKPDPEVDKTANTDYRPYLEEAAKSGFVKSKITSIGIFGASGAGKTSLLRLLQGEDPVCEHNSTPVARPLKGIWLVSCLGDKKWMEGSSDSLHKAIANYVQQIIVCNEVSPKTEQEEIDAFSLQTSLVSLTSSSPSDSSQSVFDLPATALVEKILESRHDQIVEGFHFLNITDSGGQASFIDIAPSLFPYNLLNLVVFKLTEPLKSEITFNYSIEGKLVGSEKRKITTKQLITAIFSSKSKMLKPEMKGLIYSKSFKNPLFNLFGTYYDAYKGNENNVEKLEEKNKILNDDLKDFEENLIPNGVDIIFPLNTMSRDKETQEMAEKIRGLASDYYAEVEVPVKWYLFQIAIEELKEKNEKIIPFSIFSDIGKKRNMNEEETKHALSYFHDLNICLYYPEILPQIVFTSPQYLFDNISEIVSFALGECQKTISVDLKTRNMLIKHGIFTKHLLAQLRIEFLEGLFSADDFLKLMHHLLIITPLVDDAMPGTYFMPCLLESPPDDDPINNLENLDNQCIEPLLLTWKNTVPNGLFIFLTSWLIHSSRLKLNTKHKQYRSKITLDCKHLACQIIIFEYPTFIGLAMTNTRGDAAIIKKSSNLFKMILNGIDSIVKDCKWYRAVAIPETVYICKIVECDLKTLHLCYPDVERKYLSCSEDSNLVMEQTPAHLVWFEQKVSTKNIFQKTPSHEETYSLLRDKSCMWNEIGIVLGISYDQREEFRMDLTRNNDSRLDAVVNLWLQNGGDTSTWGQLITKLQELGLNDIVSKIATYFLQ